MPNPRGKRNHPEARAVQCQEFVVGGYTHPRGGRTALGALLLGLYDADGRLRFVGKVGSGLDDRTLRRLRRRLDELRVPRSPFVDAPSYEEVGAHWARPVVVVQVRFHEWTAARRLRHPVFVGAKEDKSVREAVSKSE